MANMSYCRFENTLHDLVDCVKALEGVVYEGEPISERECKCAKIMMSALQDAGLWFEEFEKDKRKEILDKLYY